MATRKILFKVEIETDTKDFDYVKGRLWELDYKISSWCEENGFVKKYKIRKYKEKGGE